MIKLDELKVFIGAAEAGSFVRAADQFGIAPSVVSRSIKNLENRLNTTLFNRTTRKILITSEGRWLLKQAKETVDNLDEIHSHFMDNKTEPEGLLIIDAATPFALHAIAPVISKFTERFPKIQISIVSNETIADLIAEKVDVAIRVGELKDSTLKAKKIGDTKRALYASPGYLEQYGQPLCVKDLKDHKCLGFSNPKSLNIWPLLTEDGERFTTKPHMYANSGETLKQLSLHNNGIICISEFTARDELKRGELLPVLVDQIIQHSIPIYAVYYSERSVGKHIRMFLDFLGENINWDGE